MLNIIVLALGCRLYEVVYDCFMFSGFFWFLFFVLRICILFWFVALW